jgi:hypothetical protein
MPIHDPMEALQRDLQAERASALGRISERFEKALAYWNALQSGDVPARASPEAEAARRLELRDFTAEWLWMLLVQRESVGLRDHRELRERVPREIWAHLGPRLHREH